jgi:hypothetical protein
MLPAIIVGTGAAIVAVNPAVLGGIVALYAANAALRIPIKAAQYAQAHDLNELVGLIAARMQSTDTGDGLATVLDGVKQRLNDDEGTGLAQIIHDKESGINALSLTIDNSSKDYDDVSKSYWSAGPEE